MFCPADDFTCPYYVNGCCDLENAEQECDEFYDFDELEVGFDPYLGCYTDDC